ncbi:MAG: iron-containing redox enzyme family protein, partial [Bdellovibrionales bacterium]|nr:iron-containing redox enzyme family protein [Bdellovibrionales bacterium]
REVYGMWLTQQLALVQHTTRLLCLAASKEPVSAKQNHREWLKHLREETNHDIMLVQDLKKLGFEESTFPVLWSAEVIIHNQYYWLEHSHPVSLYGYSLMLEGLASRLVPQFIDRLQKAHSKESISFLKHHADFDQDHFRDGLELLNALPENLKGLVSANLRQSTALYTKLMEDVATSFRTQDDKAA